MHGLKRTRLRNSTDRTGNALWGATLYATNSMILKVHLLERYKLHQNRDHPYLGTTIVSRLVD